MARENNSKGFWRDLFLRTWHPIPTVKSTILLFTCLGSFLHLECSNAHVVKFRNHLHNIRSGAHHD